MSDERTAHDISRSDFLKLAGLSALVPLLGSAAIAPPQRGGSGSMW
jgi:hypothetical protein